jgi:hypothetical protein
MTEPDDLRTNEFGDYITEACYTNCHGDCKDEECNCGCHADDFQDMDDFEDDLNIEENML